MGSLSFINAKITCKDCGSQAVLLARTDDRQIFQCKCQTFDMSRITMVSLETNVQPEELVGLIKKEFEALNWELEELE